MDLFISQTQLHSMILLWSNLDVSVQELYGPIQYATTEKAKQLP